jgi:hypothetical protein
LVPPQLPHRATDVLLYCTNSSYNDL